VSGPREMPTARRSHSIRTLCRRSELAELYRAGGRDVDAERALRDGCEWFRMPRHYTSARLALVPRARNTRRSPNRSAGCQRQASNKSTVTPMIKPAASAR